MWAPSYASCTRRLDCPGWGASAPLSLSPSLRVCASVPGSHSVFVDTDDTVFVLTPSQEFLKRGGVHHPTWCIFQNVLAVLDPLDLHMHFESVCRLLQTKPAKVLLRLR